MRVNLDHSSVLVVVPILDRPWFRLVVRHKVGPIRYGAILSIEWQGAGLHHSFVCFVWTNSLSASSLWHPRCAISQLPWARGLWRPSSQRGANALRTSQIPWPGLYLKQLHTRSYTHGTTDLCRVSEPSSNHVLRTGHWQHRHAHRRLAA